MTQAEGIMGNDTTYNRGFTAVYLCHDDITVQTPVEPLRVSFYTNLKANTFRMRQHRFSYFSYWTVKNDKSKKLLKVKFLASEPQRDRPHSITLRLVQTYQAVLLPVVQPMTRPAGADDSLELVGFHPNDFIHTLITERGG